MCDPFDDNRGGWPTGPHEDALGKEDRVVAEGGYTWSLEATTPFFAGRKANLQPMGDFYVAVDAYRAAGPTGSVQYGLQFRWVDPANFYMFLVGDDRNFKVYRYVNGEMGVLQDWTTTAAVVPNEWNRVAVKAIGPNFTFYINDQQVAQLTDATFAKGSLRVVAQLLETGIPATVDFDNFEVRLPPTAVAAVSTPAPPAATQPPAPSAPPTDTPLPPPTDTPPPPPTDTPLPPPTDTPLPTPTDTPLPTPTDTPPPTATNTPLPPPELPTPTGTPTPVPVPPTVAGWSGGLPTPAKSDVIGWPIVFYDEFEDNGNKWPIGEDFGRVVESSQVIDTTLAWQFKGVQAFHLRLNVPYKAVSDFYAAVDVRRYSGVETVQYGIVFRQFDPANFYTYLVSDDKTFEAGAQVKERWYPLLGRTKTKAVKPGQANRVAVKCEGPKITFFINGEQVAEIEDIRFRKGTLALVLSSEKADEGIVEFDNFELRAPEGS